MDRRSPPLKQLRLLFLAALGARLGSGDQHMPMISLRDWVGAVSHLAEHDTAAGPFNLVCPDTPTNAEFTRALARALERPSFASCRHRCCASPPATWPTSCSVRSTPGRCAGVARLHLPRP